MRIHLPGALLIASLIIALVFFFALPPGRVGRTLFFPGTTAVELSAERRLVPRVRDDERSIELLVEEMLLGPTRITHSRIFPRETKLASLMLRGETVYLDLSESAMLQGSEVHVSTDIALEALRTSIRYNFRGIREVVITIAGNVPFEPAYRPVGR